MRDMTEHERVLVTGHKAASCLFMAVLYILNITLLYLIIVNTQFKKTWEFYQSLKATGPKMARPCHLQAAKTFSYHYLSMAYLRSRVSVK